MIYWRMYIVCILTKNDLLNSYLKTYKYRTYVIEIILIVYLSRFKKRMKINHSLTRCELLISSHEQYSCIVRVRIISFYGMYLSLFDVKSNRITQLARFTLRLCGTRTSCHRSCNDFYSLSNRKLYKLWSFSRALRVSRGFSWFYTRLYQKYNNKLSFLDNTVWNWGWNSM